MKGSCATKKNWETKLAPQTNVSYTLNIQ